MNKESPSMDMWLKEAKSHDSSEKVGMYLSHNGVVRETAKAKVRQGEKDTKPVRGMYFSYDKEKLDNIIESAYILDGIYSLMEVPEGGDN